MLANFDVEKLNKIMVLTWWPGVRRPLNSEREDGVRYLPLPCCVLEQRHIYSPKITGNTQEVLTLEEGTMLSQNFKIFKYFIWISWYPHHMLHYNFPVIKTAVRNECL